jgi:hypothetical protein
MGATSDTRARRPALRPRRVGLLGLLALLVAAAAPGPSIAATGGVTEFSFGISAGAALRGITAGPDGNVWFTEQNGNRIGRITPSGVVTEFSAGISTGAAPGGITAGPDGNLWFTEQNGSRIGRITPQGVVTEFSAGISAGAGLLGITAGPDGNLWFTEVFGNRIGRLLIDQTTVSISASAIVGFGQAAAGQTVSAAPSPASLLVTTNSVSGYSLSVSRTAFSGGADIPLALAVSAPAGAAAAFAGQAQIPSSGSLTVGSRTSPSAPTGDEWSPVYSLGPVPFRPGGPTSATLTYTAVTL